MAGIISQPKTIKPLAKFGASPNNANRESISKSCYIQTNDATTPNNLLSPLSTSTTITPLVIPNNAVSVTLIGAAAFQVSEAADMSQFATIPANTPVTFEVTRQGVLYLNTGTGTAAVSFIFQTL